ncbi:hypothetical protein A33M_2060 [Rhodovulum sp. PH10]|nr:hypothetical protein A33M_2060 [Rhodovulum sp. PH10]
MAIGGRAVRVALSPHARAAPSIIGNVGVSPLRHKHGHCRRANLPLRGEW